MAILFALSPAIAFFGVLLGLYTNTIALVVLSVVGVAYIVYKIYWDLFVPIFDPAGPGETTVIMAALIIPAWLTHFYS
jgi:hypothetical protein